VSVDLVKASQLELEFLEKIEKVNVLRSPQVLRIALYRYEKKWLPLLSKVSSGPSTDLKYLPPIDVHWLWHVHMLSPVNYQVSISPTFYKQLLCS